MALLYAKASNGYLASIPVNVMGFTQSLASNGWQKLPSGLIIQWGYNETGLDNGTLWVTPPVQINTLLFISGIYRGGNEGGIMVWAGDRNVILRTRGDDHVAGYKVFGIRWLVLNT